MMQIVRYYSGEPTACAVSQALVNSHVRTSIDPCGAYCTYPDFRGWRQAARDAVVSVLQGRPDLPPATRQSLGEYLARIDAMTEGSAFSIGDQTRQLAQIHQTASCIATWDPKKTDIPQVPELPVVPTGSPITGAIWAVAAALILAIGWKATQK